MPPRSSSQIPRAGAVIFLGIPSVLSLGSSGRRLFCPIRRLLAQVDSFSFFAELFFRLTSWLRRKSGWPVAGRSAARSGGTLIAKRAEDRQGTRGPSLELVVSGARACSEWQAANFCTRAAKQPMTWATVDFVSGTAAATRPQAVARGCESSVECCLGL